MERFTNTGIAELEKEMLTNYMEKFDGNITRVANELHMARSTIYRKLKKYGLY